MAGNEVSLAQGERLRLARQQAGHKTATDGWNAVKRSTKSSISKDAYIQHENGHRSLKSQARDYAAGYGVPEEWLVWGKNPPEWAGGDESSERPRSIPIISWVAAGDLADPSHHLPEGSETLELGDLGPGEFFATRVRGDSMDRIAPDDALLVVNRQDIDLVRGGRYIFTLGGKTTFKRYGEDPPHLLPESLNPSHHPRILKPADKWSVVGRVRKVIIDV